MPGFTGLKQNYYLLKILQPELDRLLIWLGIIHATIDMWRPKWGWPPKKAGAIGIAGTQLDIVSLQVVSLAEKLDLFTWWLRAPRGWKQKLRVHAQRWNSTTFTPSICQSKVPGQGKYPPPAGSADYGLSFIYRSAFKRSNNKTDSFSVEMMETRSQCNAIFKVLKKKTASLKFYTSKNAVQKLRWSKDVFKPIKFRDLGISRPALK